MLTVLVVYIGNHSAILVYCPTKKSVALKLFYALVFKSCIQVSFTKSAAFSWHNVLEIT